MQLTINGQTQAFTPNHVELTWVAHPGCSEAFKYAITEKQDATLEEVADELTKSLPEIEFFVSNGFLCFKA